MLNRRILKVFSIIISLSCTVILFLIIQKLNAATEIIENQKYQQQQAAVEAEAELILDRRAAPSEQEIFAAIQNELPSLPFEFWQRNRAKHLQMNATCAQYPNLYNLHYYNDYWQLHTSELHGQSNLSFKLFGAYYDKRAAIIEATPQGERRPVVRILAMINYVAASPASVSSIPLAFTQNYCQLWFNERRQPLIVPVAEYRLIWHKYWGALSNHFYPYLLTCILPKDVATLIPQTVSLVAHQCAQASNSLRIIFNELPAHRNRTKGDFAVCVKGLDFPYVDLSARLVEWLELMRLLGAEKVIAYDLQLHPNISKALNYYRADGFLELHPLSLAHGAPGARHFRHMAMQLNRHNKVINELIPYNDCFYRNMYKYRYIALVDIDEVIMPLGNLTSWHDIIEVGERMRSSKCKSFASFCFSNVYFPKYETSYSSSSSASSIPSYLYMLQHVQRVAQHSRKDLQTKCLHNTDYIVTLHNHYPMSWMQSCKAEHLPESIAQLQHYRDPAKRQLMADNPVVDTSIWRYKHVLVNRTTQVLRELGFFKNEH